jgi:hypothetical protein
MDMDEFTGEQQEQQQPADVTMDFSDDDALQRPPSRHGSIFSTISVADLAGLPVNRNDYSDEGRL